MDVDSIDAGASFTTVLSEVLSESGVLVAIVGPTWLGLQADGTPRLREPNDFVRQEILTAFDKNIRIIPVLVGGATMPKTEQLPEGMEKFSHLNALEVRHTRFDSDVASLIQAIETALQEFEAARLQEQSKQEGHLQPPSLETKKFLRRHLGEPKGFRAVIFGSW